MSKYAYYEGEGYVAVTKSTEEVQIVVGVNKPIEIPRQVFKDIEETPESFNKKYKIVKGEIKNVDKNE